MSDSNRLRKNLTRVDRSYEPQHHIDAGFLNYRRLLMFVPEELQEIISNAVGGPSPIDPMAKLKRDHLYIQSTLKLAKSCGCVTVGELLAGGNPTTGDFVCSTSVIVGNEGVYQKNTRVELPIRFDFETEFDVFLRFSTSNILADTARDELSKTNTMSFVARVDEIIDNSIYLGPLVMGAPWLNPDDSGDANFDLMNWHFSYFEHFIEDIDEFEKVFDVPRIEDSDEWKILKDIPESGIKKAFTQILGDVSHKDWGGEQSDHFSTSVHLNQRRISAAFLLKGPSDFTEMKARHLGKNGDQIYRLAQEPASLLVLQHCHLVSPPVHATLRAFAVSPANPRRYCVIDGPDTFRFLKAYNLMDIARNP